MVSGFKLLAKNFLFVFRAQTEEMNQLRDTRWSLAGPASFPWIDWDTGDDNDPSRG